MEQQKIKVLIAEDHELTRIGLMFSLQKSNLIEIVGEAEDGQEAVEKTLQTKPDIVLMDLGLPVIDGLEATKRIKNSMPEIKIVILTSHKEQNEVIKALESGANAYCLKDIKPERLINALDSIMDGILWIDSPIANGVTNYFTQNKDSINNLTTETNTEKQKYNMTPRELEVIEYLVEGFSNKDIAETMNISIYTVKRHISGIIEKFEVLDRTQAALKALKIGLIKKK